MLPFVLLLVGCVGGPTDPRPADSNAVDPSGQGPVADVVEVTSAGEDGAYTFSVTVRSDETGCDRYADWWEVVTPAGELVFRRILEHSHPDEQPFTRSGGPVPVGADEEVVVRAHLHPDGYGGQVVRGSVAGGFTAEDPEPGFAAGLEEHLPLPEGCAF